MKEKSIYIAVAAAAILVPLALLLRTFSASPLAMPKPYEGPIPSAMPPKELAVFAVVTGVNHRVAAFGYRGGSFFDRRDFSMAGTLVKHPQGDLLIDTGFGRNINQQFRIMPLFSVRSPPIACGSLPQTSCGPPATARNHCVPFFSPIRTGTTSAACPTLQVCLYG